MPFFFADVAPPCSGKWGWGSRDSQKKNMERRGSARTTRVARRGVGANNRANGSVVRRTPPTRRDPYPVSDTPNNTTTVVVDVDDVVAPPSTTTTVPSDDEQASNFSSTGKNGARIRNFVFTLNNYTEEEYNWFLHSHGNPTWFIVGKEICPTTNTPHLQGMQQTLAS